MAVIKMPLLGCVLNNKFHFAIYIRFFCTLLSFCNGIFRKVKSGHFDALFGKPNAIAAFATSHFNTNEIFRGVSCGQQREKLSHSTGSILLVHLEKNKGFLMFLLPKLFLFIV